MHWTYPRDRARIVRSEAASKLEGDSSTTGGPVGDLEAQKLRTEPLAHVPHTHDGVSEPEVRTVGAFHNATRMI